MMAAGRKAADEEEGYNSTLPRDEMNASLLARISAGNFFAKSGGFAVRCESSLT